MLIVRRQAKFSIQFLQCGEMRWIAVVNLPGQRLSVRYV